MIGRMSDGPVVVFCMGARGHFQRLRPLIAALARRGIDVAVFTSDDFAADVGADGGRFVDLFADRPPGDADGESRPFPVRWVGFAGHYGESVVAEVASLSPSLVIADGFAVIGRVVATALDIPYVNVCAGHNVDPDRFIARMAVDPRLHVSDACERAVATLRDRFGMEDASGLSFIDGRSSLLNVYCEPPQYLTDDERLPFEPMAFFGSLPATAAADAVLPGAGRSRQRSRPVEVFVSLGTVVWWPMPEDPKWTNAADALRTMETVTEALGSRSDVDAVVGLGNADLDPATVDRLRRPNIRVERYVDQWQVLSRSDVFITHHGLNSTHESIFHGVPMVSYPFFWDQPGLAEKCQAFGFALPLAPALRAPVEVEMVHAALDEVAARRDDLGAALAQAREWELAVMAGREEVVQRVADLRQR